QNDWNPSWSPDGRFIVFHRANGNTSDSDLYILSADGTGVRQLTSGPTWDSNPEWSPDGTRIAFYRAGAIWTITSIGSGARMVAPDGAHPDWSPDGKRIAFWSQKDGMFAVYVVNADGTALRRLTSDTLAGSN